MTRLNTQQHTAICYTTGHLLVLAGAGSGKTRVITEKIAYLIKNHKALPEHILAVTFTNKAANEMRERIHALMADQIKHVHISTFHTLGLRILQQEYAHIGYRRGFTIFDSTDTQTLLRELLRDKENRYAGDESAAAWTISRLKNDLLDNETAIHQNGNPYDPALASLYTRYQRQLMAYNAVDFDDLILQPVLLFRNNSDVLLRWQTRVRHFLVDEYQDTNLCQYELVKLLLGTEGILTAVGDDDQSIYAWRGARPENLLRLNEDYPLLKIIKLEQNYRSTGRILNAANSLIQNNPHIIEKTLWSELGHGEPVRVLPCKTAENEAERVIAELLHTKFHLRTRNRDFAILYRSNHQSRLFENALRLHNLPYQVSGGTAFFDRAEIKDILAYLRLLANPDDDAAFLRIINTPRREIGATTLEKLGDFAGHHHISLLTASLRPDIETVLSGAALTRLSRFTDWLQEKTLSSRSLDAHQLTHAIIRETEYTDWMLNTCKDKEIAQRRIENVTALLDWIHNMCKQNESILLLDELVGKLCLMDILERKGNENETDAVQLITIHAAKGLEFPHVFLVGMEEGSLPHHSSETENRLEEERRLAYVGMTRAQKTLTLTFAESRKKHGQWVNCQPSRFLHELPLEDIHWEDTDLPDRGERKSRGNANLASLREMLGKNAP